MVNMEGIPEHMRSGVEGYLTAGEEPGGFLRAVLENDLVGAFGKADSINQAAMLDWADFLYNQMPETAWGSRAKVNAWIKAREEERK